MTEEELMAVMDRHNDYHTRHTPTGFACCRAHASADDVPALLNYIGQLEAELEENTGIMQALRRQRDEAEADTRPLPRPLVLGRFTLHAPQPPGTTVWSLAYNDMWLKIWAEDEATAIAITALETQPNIEELLTRLEAAPQPVTWTLLKTIFRELP